MHADTAKALDCPRKPEHDCVDVGHHECKGARDIGIGSTELREELDHFSMRVVVSGVVSGYPNSES